MCIEVICAGVYVLLSILTCIIHTVYEINECRIWHDKFVLTWDRLWLNIFIGIFWPIGVMLLFSLGLEWIGNIIRKVSKKIFKNPIFTIDFSKNKIDTSDEWMK